MLKPGDAEKLEAIRKRFQKYQERRVVVRLSKDHIEDLPYHRISYIENDHNNLLIHLTNGSFLQIRESMQRFMENLDERFLRVNRGIIVNMEAIERMDCDSCRVEGLIFMHMKDVQIAVDSEYIVVADIFQDRNDVWNLVPFLKEMEAKLGFRYPIRIPEISAEGKKRVKLEILLLCLGYNLNKLHGKIQNGRTGSYLFEVKSA